MSDLYGDSHRHLQHQFDTVRLADRLEERLFKDHIGEEQKVFIESCDMFFLATADKAGRPNCSYRGGDPGFVRILDPHTLMFPNYDGNGMYLSMGNTLENANVGLLFIDFVKRKRLRLNGTARIEPATAADPPYPECQFVVIVTAEQVFPNCPRYIHQMQLVERSSFVPRAEVQTPIPAWKQSDWARDVLPEGDPASRGNDVAKKT